MTDSKVQNYSVKHVDGVMHLTIKAPTGPLQPTADVLRIVPPSSDKDEAD